MQYIEHMKHTNTPPRGSEVDGDEGEVSSSELVVYFPEDGHMGLIGTKGKNPKT